MYNMVIISELLSVNSIISQFKFVCITTALKIINSIFNKNIKQFPINSTLQHNWRQAYMTF